MDFIIGLPENKSVSFFSSRADVHVGLFPVRVASIYGAKSTLFRCRLKEKIDYKASALSSSL